jgi:hypothetical protein
VLLLICRKNILLLLLLPLLLLLLLNCIQLSWAELYYDRRSVGQSVLEQSTHLGLTTRFLLLSDHCGFFIWGALSDERTHLSFTMYNIQYSLLSQIWDQDPVFTSPRNRVARLYPQALGISAIDATRTTQKTQPPLLKYLCWGYHVIAIQPIHWHDDYCLATNYNILHWDTAYIVASWNTFTELLPGNALIRSITVLYSEFPTTITLEQLNCKLVSKYYVYLLDEVLGPTTLPYDNLRTWCFRDARFESWPRHRPSTIVLWFSLVPPGKYCDSTPIIPWPLPSKSFLIHHQSSYRSTLCSLDTESVVK